MNKDQQTLSKIVQKYYGELTLVIVTILAALSWLFSKYALLELPPAGGDQRTISSVKCRKLIPFEYFLNNH